LLQMQYEEDSPSIIHEDTEANFIGITPPRKHFLPVTVLLF
jgi:hypothetical protein